MTKLRGPAHQLLLFACVYTCDPRTPNSPPAPAAPYIHRQIKCSQNRHRIYIPIISTTLRSMSTSQSTLPLIWIVSTYIPVDYVTLTILDDDRELTRMFMACFNHDLSLSLKKMLSMLLRVTIIMKLLWQIIPPCFFALETKRKMLSFCI